MASFTLKLGSLDLAGFLRVAPGDGFDPADNDFVEPQFSGSPLREGGALVSTTVGLRELAWPLHLNAASKDALHQLVRDVEREGQVPGGRVEWRDAGATASTFFDVEAVRFEPDYNFRRSEHNYADGTLRIWVQPWGHTATERIVATAAASGVLVRLSPAPLEGDVPALLSAAVVCGSQVPSGGRLVALSVLPNASYAPEIPAASLISAMGGGATLIGASGAAGSQLLGLPIDPRGRAEPVARFGLPAASAYGGDNRVFALVRSQIDEPIGLSLRDHEGNVLGPTALATAQQGLQLVDLGVKPVPSQLVLPTAMEMTLWAGAVVASGAGNARALASPGLHLNEVIVLPEHQTALISDPGGGAQATLTALDPFVGLGKLNGAADLAGNPWARGLCGGSAGLMKLLVGAYSFQGDGMATKALYAHRLDVLPERNLAVVARVRPRTRSNENWTGPRKEIATNGWVWGRIGPSAAFLDLRVMEAGAIALLASVALATAFDVEADYLVGLGTDDSRAFLTVANTTGSPIAYQSGSAFPVASIGASHAAVATRGQPGLAGMADFSGPPAVTESDHFVRGFLAGGLASSMLTARDTYNFNDILGETWRRRFGGDLSARLAGDQRGRTPRLSPSGPPVVALVAPREQGTANDLLDVTLRVRERFSYFR